MKMEGTSSAMGEATRLKAQICALLNATQLC